MAEITVLLGPMSTMLYEALEQVINAEPDMRVVVRGDPEADVLATMSRTAAMVLIVQGSAPPEPLATLLAIEPFGVLTIHESPTASKLTRIFAEHESFEDLSCEKLIAAVRCAARRVVP